MNSFIYGEIMYNYCYNLSDVGHLTERSKPMLTRIHVNQHVIKANAKHGKCDPVFTVKQGKSNTYAHRVK